MKDDVTIQGIQGGGFYVFDEAIADSNTLLALFQGSLGWSPGRASVAMLATIALCAATQVSALPPEETLDHMCSVLRKFFKLAREKGGGERKKKKRDGERKKG